MKGKLIVFEGIDGSGKATQTRLLFNYLKKRRIPVEAISFPRYQTVYGKLIKRMHQGELGKNISPYLACLPFAMDRRAARNEIVSWLRQGRVVLADRYVTASMAHQAARLPQGKQDEFTRWLDHLEYQVHGLPKEQVVIFLKMPAAKSQKLMKRKDALEKNVAYQKKALAVYRKLAKRFSHWAVLEGVDKEGGVLPKKEVHQRVLEALKRRKII